MREPDDTADPTEVGVKGSIFRAVVAVLVDHGIRDAVLGRVSAATQALILDPPLPTMWLDARLQNEVYQAILELGGPDKLRRVNREAIDHGVSPLLRASAERVLRIFGASPGALLAKLDRVAGSTARGVVYHYTEINNGSGHFELEYPSLDTVPLGAFVATGGGLELIFDLCGVRGTMGDPTLVANGKHNRMRFLVSWREVTRR